MRRIYVFMDSYVFIKINPYELNILDGTRCGLREYYDHISSSDEFIWRLYCDVDVFLKRNYNG